MAKDFCVKVKVISVNDNYNPFEPRMLYFSVQSRKTAISA